MNHLGIRQVNVACGEALMPGFVNIDVRSDVGADIVCDCLDTLPFQDSTIDLLRADDFLEHVPPDLHKTVLTDWHRVLTPGGTLQIRVPNMLALSEAIANSEDPDWQTALIRNIYGGHRWGEHGNLDCHHWGWTPPLLANLLAHHGFEAATNDGALNMTVTATKPQ